jgi:hypothetical protein
MRYREDNKRKRGYDYGILMRANPSKRDPRLWIVFAGVGRAACVASRVLVFEEKWEGASGIDFAGKVI